jgi:hypothetical protein
MTNTIQHHSTVQSVQVNRQWTLATRPVGAPTLGNFHLRDGKIMLFPMASTY